MPRCPRIASSRFYIAQHFRGLITNQAVWTTWPAIALIQGEGRKFAEKSVADYPSPTPAQVKEADEVVAKVVPHDVPFATGKVPVGLPALGLASSLLFYVGVPAVVAALLFRGGLVLLLAGVTYVKKNGERASRLRLFWRSLVVWAPTFPVFVLSIIGMAKHSAWLPWLALALLGVLAAVSVALPQRGLQDRLAGTWPVPR